MGDVPFFAEFASPKPMLNLTRHMLRAIPFRIDCYFDVPSLWIAIVTNLVSELSPKRLRKIFYTIVVDWTARRPIMIHCGPPFILIIFRRMRDTVVILCN